MRYWWVNQNQTHQQEIGGGYLWSPQRRRDGARHPYYESMREVSPGDIVFSFVNTRIHAIGIAQSFCYECPRPDEFGAIGEQWDQVGWRVDVRFTREPMPMRPKDHMDVLAPHLPARYAPLRSNGDGLQQVYLTELPFDFAEALARLMGRPVLDMVREHLVYDQAVEFSEPGAITAWEAAVAKWIESSNDLSSTEKESLIQARRGQGAFRRAVLSREHACRITGVDRPEHLRASHCKPWRDCETNEERLDGENGLMLTPSIDHLFDRGFISFEDNGRLLVSRVASQESLRRMGVAVSDSVNVGSFTQAQREYLGFHRERVFLQRS